MKKIFFTAVAASILFLSCSKTNNSGNNLITGKWELRESAGGIAGTIKYAAGNGVIVQFDNGNRYQFISSSIVTDSGTYQLSKARNPGDWMLNRQYTYNGQTQTATDSVRVTNNQLIFIARWACCDMPTLSYEKLNKD